jgi:hypothetical protein
VNSAATHNRLAELRLVAFDIDGVPPGATVKGALITLTAIAGGRAIEATTRLD